MGHMISGSVLFGVTIALFIIGIAVAIAGIEYLINKNRWWESLYGWYYVWLFFI